MKETKIFTVRMHKLLWTQLREYAHNNNISFNKALSILVEKNINKFIKLPLKSKKKK